MHAPLPPTAPDGASPSSATCRVCARALMPEQGATKVCADRRCRRVWLEERPRRRGALASQAEALRDAQATAAGIASPESFGVVLIPSHDAPAIRLPKHRRRALRAHLAPLVARAMAARAVEAATGAPATGAPAPASDGATGSTVESTDPGGDLGAALSCACARCGGYCCREGGDHAYLTERVIHRHLDGHPEATAADVLDTYLGHLPAVTMRRSCIYHGTHGCGLPRALRSDTCNRYFCEGLQRVRDAGADAPVRLFLAQITDDGEGDVRSGAFVDARDVRVVRRARPPAP